MFHNSINIQQPELELYREKAKKQNDMILELFEKRAGKWLTPFHVQSILKASTGRDIPITSVRRGISDLCKEGKLLKSVGATVKGAYNVANHVWTLAI